VHGGEGIVGEREEALAAVNARLERATALEDLSPVLEPEAMIEARRLVGTFTGGDGDLPAQYLIGWLHWYRLLALPRGDRGDDDEKNLQAAIGLFLPCFLVGAGEPPEPLLPLIAEQAIPQAKAWLEEALGSTDPALLSGVAGLWQRILDTIPAGHRNRGVYLTNLGVALQTRFRQTGVMADLDAAIDAGRAAADATPAGHLNRAGCLNNPGSLAARPVRADRGVG
jgi:hypothetical protein